MSTAADDHADDPFSRLDAHQRDLLATWLPGAVVLADHSWGLVSTRVLEVEHAGVRYAVKVAGPQDTHLVRELEGHRRWTAPWVREGRAPVLVHADLAARVLVTRWVPGVLALGTPAQHAPDVHRQAGALLAALHGQERVVDPDGEHRDDARALAWLDQPHALPPSVEQRVRHLLSSTPAGPVTLVPTHGDWQPRNWVVDEDGVVRVIDLGRAALRPAAADVVRLHAQEWRAVPELHDAFVEGYGHDPRGATWWRTYLREGVCTAAWSHRVGDAAFEAQGLRMVDEALVHL